jgi:hypothetical protein
MSRQNSQAIPDISSVSRGALDYMEIIIRGKSDPVWFIENVLEQPLWPAQRDMVRNFYRNKYDPAAKPYKKCVLGWGQRCNVGESLISTSNGIKRLDEIIPNDMVYSLDGWRKVIEVYDVGIKDSISIKTQLGFNVKCSTEHKWYTARGWVESQHLTLNDSILMCVPEGVISDDIINENISMILGYLIAEGTTTTDDILRFTNGDISTLQHFDSLILKEFGYITKRSKRGIDSNITKGGVIHLLRYYGLPYAKAKTKTVPHSVLQSSSNIKVAFLRAYFEGDGWACNNNKVPEVGCSTISIELAQQVQLMLLEIGIVASIVTKVPHAFSKDYEASKNIPYHVKINGANILKFKEVVGFITDRKNKVLNECCVSLLKKERLNKVEPQRYLKIKKIEYTEPAHMYDLLVDGSHSYLCNGLMSHNSGKTAIMACIGLYEMFDICTLENPAAHYGLLKNQVIMIPVLAPSEDQVMRGVFGNMVQYVENNQFLKEWMGWQTSKYAIFSASKNVRIEPYGSWANTGRGSTSKAVIFDEMDYFEDTTNRRGGHEVYAAMSKSTATLGDDAHVFVISSIKSSVSQMSKLLREARTEVELYGEANSRTYFECKPTWEINPKLTKEALMKEFEFDLPTFWRDYGSNPSMWSSMTFPDGVELKEMANVLKPLVRQQNFRGRFLAIDPAYKNDGFGIACGYMGSDGVIVIDGAIKYRKSEGSPTITPSEVKKFVQDAISYLGVHTLVFDIFMFPDILEMAEKMGVITVKHIVSKADYDNMRSLMQQNKCNIVYNIDLKKELEELENKNDKKCDHPLTGSKDCADCCANIVWGITQMDQPEMLVNIPFCGGF